MWQHPKTWTHRTCDSVLKIEQTTCDSILKIEQYMWLNKSIMFVESSKTVIYKWKVNLIETIPEINSWQTKYLLIGLMQM